MPKKIKMPRKTCPRCSAPTQTTFLTPPTVGETFGCTRCTWPNPSWSQVVATLARRGLDAMGRNFTNEGLEEFASTIGDSTVLTDSVGRKVTAKVIKVMVQDGKVDVTFEFDPNAWQVPS